MATVTHDSEILTPAVVVAQDNSDATHYGVWHGDPDSGGTFLWGNSLSNNPNAARTGDRWRFAAGAIVLTQNSTAGRESDDLQQRKLAGVIAGGLYVAMHTGNPGTTGANLIPNSKKLVSDWTVSAA